MRNRRHLMNGMRRRRRRSAGLSADGTVRCAREIPLAMAERGETGTVVAVGGNPGMRRYVTGLGFTPGSELSVIDRTPGDVIVRIRSSRIALDAAMAADMLIRTV